MPQTTSTTTTTTTTTINNNNHHHFVFFTILGYICPICRYFRQPVNASSLPLFQAAPASPPRWDRRGWPTDGRQPISRKKHHVKNRYIKKGHGKQTARVRSYSSHHQHRVNVFNGSAESEWTEREKSRTVSPTVRPCTLCLCLSVCQLLEVIRGLTGWSHWFVGCFLVKRLINRFFKRVKTV